VKQIIDVCYFK